MSFDIRRASREDLNRLNELNPRNKKPEPIPDIPNLDTLELWDLIPDERHTVTQSKSAYTRES